MMISRRHLLGLIASSSVLPLLHTAQVPAFTADQVHRELVEGNDRFIRGRSRHPHSSLAWARRNSKEQHPHGVILCCSDSRVSPEILFDQGLGDLFVVRVAGNVANEDEVASIEYAVEHLKVPLCVVLGHTRCGAVTAVAEGATLPPEIEHLVAPIRLSYEKEKGRSPEVHGEALIQATVQANVVNTVQALSGGSILHERITAGHLRIEGAVYDLETGRVGWLQASR